MRLFLTNLSAGLLCLLMYFPFQATAQTTKAPKEGYDDKFFSDLEWRNIGPYRGGRSLGAAGSPGRPMSTILALRVVDSGKQSMVEPNGFPSPMDR
jgi:hypothetical protein